MKRRLKLRLPVSTLAALMLRPAALPALAITALLASAWLFAPPAQATPNPTVTHAPAATHGVGLAPAGLVATMARTQAQAAAKNPAYAIARNGCAKLEDRTGAPVLTGCFGHTGPAFSTGKQTIRLRLSAWGRAGRLRPVALTRMAPRANRIAYRGRHIVQWWRVLPLGYEQGFTIEQAPAGTGKVVLQLTANRPPTIAHGTLAWGRLRYGKLHVTDAGGAVLPATLTARGKLITLAFDAAQARYPVTVDPLVWVQQQVTANNGAASDYFGTSVALSANGATALVGATYGNSSKGAAYVYTLANGTWSQAAELTDSYGAKYNYFGSSVTLSADGATALVGADNKKIGNNSGQGAAYVYTEPSSGGWATTPTYTAKLTAKGGATNDQFGISVALSADGATALVGAYGKNSRQGAAYVYAKPGSGWVSPSTYSAELTASDGAAGDYFGISVTLSADGATALVGADFKKIGSNKSQGAAYVYAKPGSGWVSTSAYTAELTASDGATNDYFGSSVALSADGATALVGADFKKVGGNNAQGAAYVYTKPGSGWAKIKDYTTELTASNGVANDGFGFSVALSADGATALVGADGKNSRQGAAYVYAKPGSGWVSTSAYTAELTASDGAANDDFGTSVALSADGATALVGADGKTIGGNKSQGAAYFFTNTDFSAVLHAPATVVSGGQFDSQYILTNLNASATSGPVTITLPLPTTGAGYVSASASQGSCSYDTTAKVATCRLGSIAGNAGTANATLTLKATGAVGSAIAQSAQLAGGVSSNLKQSATTTIAVKAAPPPSGGGGSFGALGLLALALLGFLRPMSRKRREF